jgi:lipopolysaccharide transport system permease protein
MTEASAGGTPVPVRRRLATGRGTTPGSFLVELWAYRELFYFLAWRDIKVRYKQTALGVLWAIIQPLVTMIIFTLLFGRLAKLPSDGTPHPVFYLSALLPWTYFSSMLASTGNSLVGNAPLLTKVYFPRIILPAAAAFSGIVDLGIGSLLLFGLMGYYRIAPTWNLLLWLAAVFPLVLFTLGVGMSLSALNVKYRDVKYAIPFVIQLWLFVTPIIYPASIIPERYRFLLALNPMTGIVALFRHALVPSNPLDWTMVGTSSALVVTAFLAAIWYFRKAEREFSDIV